MYGTTEERFWIKVDKDGPIPEKRPELGQCWCWTGAKNTKGYGSIRESMSLRFIKAHRFAYELLVEPIPKDLTIDHLCRNRGCVNPAHMEPVTNAVNGLRGNGVGARAARVTHCPKGHLYDLFNTGRIRRGKGSQRRCIECHRLEGRTGRPTGVHLGLRPGAQGQQA